MADKRDKKQAEFDADEEHQKASNKLDKAFGYGRLNLGQSHTYDAPLTVRNTGPFNYKAPKDRPLKQESWDENPRGEKRGEINETGSYAKGGKVGKVGKIGQFGMHRSKPDFAGGGPQTNRKFNFKKGDM